MTLPRLVVHADWSIHPRKRWVAMATATRDGSAYRVAPPRNVEAPDALVRTAMEEAGGGCVVLGFDFPIGVPESYARNAGIGPFLDVLPELGTGRWKEFYDPATRPEEISTERPFYPARPGGTRQAHLVQGLRVASMKELLRRCDFGSAGRGNACSLFWTLGGNQVGRAAISGWRQMLVPAMKSLKTELGVWPFDGDLGTLIADRACVIAETYPAEACVQLGLPAPGRKWSKRKQDDRRRRGPKLFRWAKGKPVDLSDIDDVIGDGFGSARDGEDRFDAVVGLLGMLSAILGLRDEGRPFDDSTRTVEGWILGQHGPNDPVPRPQHE